MQITLYRRTFPVKDAPEGVSFVSSAHQRHTYTVGAKVYEGECSELQIVVPDGAKIDALRNLLIWGGGKGSVKSTAQEVFDLARACASGFRMAK